MIVYLDTSALLKLLVDEPGRELMLEVADTSPIATTSVLTEVESRAALARMRAGGRLTAGQHRDAVARFEELWTSVGALDIDPGVLRQAVSLAERHALRGYDAVHLASALAVPAAAGQVAFACFDEELRSAAKSEQLDLTPATLG